MKAKFNHLKKYYSEYNLFFTKKFKKEININQKILDVGCGHMRNSYFLHELGFKNIYAIDWQIPKPNFDLQNTSINFTQHNIIYEFPFESHSFDIVFCNYVLMFIKDEHLTSTLDSLSRVTKKFLLIEVYDLERNLKTQNETDFTKYNFYDIVSFFESHDEFDIVHKKFDGKIILRRVG